MNPVNVLSQETDYNNLFEDLEDDLNKEKNKEGKTKSLASDVFIVPNFIFAVNGEHQFEFHFPLIPGYWEFSGPVKAPRFNNVFGIDLVYENVKVTSNWQFNLILNEWTDWVRRTSLK